MPPDRSSAGHAPRSASAALRRPRLQPRTRIARAFDRDRYLAAPDAQASGIIGERLQADGARPP